MFYSFIIGTTELIVIGGAVLLLFGGKKIPELMRSLGTGIKNFKEGMNAPVSKSDPEMEETQPEEVKPEGKAE